MEDKELVNELKSHKEASIHELTSHYGGMILYIIRGILYDYQMDIDECYNDVLMKIWDNIFFYDSNKSGFSTWITHITRNTALDRLKSITRHNSHFEDTSEERRTLGDSTYEAVERLEQQRENIKLLNNAIDVLKEKEKEIFLRKYYYMQSMEQIAVEMDRTVKSVESILYRVRKKLAVLIKGGSDDGQK